MTTAHTDPARRHDAVVLFDVTNGNPNGDPDNDNLPRVSPYNGHGLVTDVAVKRKIRNWVSASRPDTAGFRIYVEEGTALNARHGEAYAGTSQKATKTPTPDVLRPVRDWMCATFFDVRVFGAVMSTQINAGQVKGPVQLTFAESFDPVAPQEHAITRVAVTREQDLAKFYEGTGDDGKGGKNREMGRKAILPYALFGAHVYYSPYYGQRNGVTTEDLSLLWEALVMGWDLDRSSAKGDMCCRGLYVYSHQNPLGNAPAHKLLSRIKVARTGDVLEPRAFCDYTVTVSKDPLPDGVVFSQDLS